MTKLPFKILLITGIMLVSGLFVRISPVTQLLYMFLLLIILIFLVIGLLTFRANIKPGPPPYAKIKYNNIDVSFQWKLNGGGIICAYEFVRLIREKIGKVDHVYEYCAGPGFIGFSLLANNLCNRLTLSDVNPEAIECVRQTIQNNHLENKVTVYTSDGLNGIPPEELWDLVVGNPPWMLAPQKGNVRVVDPNGRVHEDFFKNIGQHLKPEGSILLIEGGEYTTPATFAPMIEANGLRMAEAIPPISFGNIFRQLKEYKNIGLSLPLAYFVRMALAFRETYFLWIIKQYRTTA